MIAIVFYIFWLICCYFCLYRNTKVLYFRKSLIKKIQSFPLKENIFYFNPDWRIDTFNQVPYWKMVFTFWKPLKPKSFWKDLSFLKEEK